MLIRFFLLCLCFAPLSGYAAGPSTIASYDRSAWPWPVNSQVDFDTASRAEILVFVRELAATEQLDEAAWKQRLGLKRVDMASLAKVRERFWGRLFENYRMAMRTCEPERPLCDGVGDRLALSKLAQAWVVAPDSPLFAWSEDSQRFHLDYLNEQMRLAALFPRVSSEIDTFSAQEITGDELEDGEFMLTFDDGPTGSNGNTDKLADTLRAQGVSGTFFVLGSNLQRRQQSGGRALDEVYAGQCVASHGWEHKSHASWNQWQRSVSRTQELINAALPAQAVPLFRPPYGQRKADGAAFFDQQKIKVALWQIDSQDWNSKVNAKQVQDRVLTLMLLWRRGVLLFHDVHPKAAAALPALLNQTGQAVHWVNCRKFP